MPFQFLARESQQWRNHPLLLPLVCWHRSEFFTLNVASGFEHAQYPKSRKLYLAALTLAPLDPGGGMEICVHRRRFGAFGEPPSDVSPASKRFRRHRAFESPLDGRTSIGIPHNQPSEPPGRACNSGPTNPPASSHFPKSLRATMASCARSPHPRSGLVMAAHAL